MLHDAIAHRSLLLAAAILAGAGLAIEAQPQPSFRSGVELVSLSVTAIGAGGQHVRDLTADDFLVLEDGLPQDLVFFSHATARLAVSLLIDSSASMLHRMDVARAAARDFVARLRPGDIAQVIHFDSRVQLLQPFTDDRDALNRAIDSITPAGLTALYNAIYIALGQAADAGRQSLDEARRHVIVVLSDGEDTASLIEFDALLDAARRSHTVIFTIGLALEALDLQVTRILRDDPAFVLRRLAAETGGRFLVADEPRELRAVYTEIADELTGQYVLGYSPKMAEHRDEWRNISVRVNRENVHARTRPGYYAPTAPRTAAR